LCRSLVRLEAELDADRRRHHGLEASDEVPKGAGDAGVGVDAVVGAGAGACFGDGVETPAVVLLLHAEIERVELELVLPRLGHPLGHLHLVLDA
jgi:hypothetical protein